MAVEPLAMCYPRQPRAPRWKRILFCLLLSPALDRLRDLLVLLRHLREAVLPQPVRPYLVFALGTGGAFSRHRGERQPRGRQGLGAAASEAPDRARRDRSESHES